MGLIEDELSEVKRLAEHLITGCRLVSCFKTMVRAEIKRTPFKTVIVCIQFPENYPSSIILIELKSKTLSEKLLSGLNNVCESEAKKHIGKPQVLQVLKFVSQFINENPLCCCYDEISSIKRNLNDIQDELKLKQKDSSLSLKVVNNKYFLKTRIKVPDIYPGAAVGIDDINTNFPSAFAFHMLAQVREISRQCVEPPLRKPKPSDPPFVKKPSLEKSSNFLIDCVKRLPCEQCQLCKEQCFPDNPDLSIVDENSPKFIERVYCGHLFHQDCLLKYLKSPPFGNKACQSCGKRIYHHKWTISDRVAENRWAHEQARDRELSEVEDFFK